MVCYIFYEYNSPVFVPLSVYLSINVSNHASNVLKHTNIGYYVKKMLAVLKHGKLSTFFKML